MSFSSPYNQNQNPNNIIPKEIPDVIGIKFGSRNTVLGTVKNHAVDTLNLTNREIPSMVSFTNSYPVNHILYSIFILYLKISKKYNSIFSHA